MIQIRPEVVVYELDLILTALSLSQSEILWEFIWCSQLTAPQKKREAFHFKDKHDGRKRSEHVDGAFAVGPLLEMTINVQCLLLKYRTSICLHRLECLKVEILIVQRHP